MTISAVLAIKITATVNAPAGTRACTRYPARNESVLIVPNSTDMRKRTRSSVQKSTRSRQRTATVTKRKLALACGSGGTRASG